MEPSTGYHVGPFQGVLDSEIRSIIENVLITLKVWPAIYSL